MPRKKHLLPSNCSISTGQLIAASLHSKPLYDAKIKTGDGPQGARGCEASDTSRKSRVSHLQCSICAQQ
ncbi:hypothetical protein XENOCAPTIV_015607 [Xenoophorus captivus]|uniref:Uncharacterized protein n=1 Tax=Xenoophorus captivus TaxID=1517983 RepID=A0ABV0S514_9TELE